MWIRVALNKNDVHYGTSTEYTYVDGENGLPQKHILIIF